MTLAHPLALCTQLALCVCVGFGPAAGADRAAADASPKSGFPISLTKFRSHSANPVFTAAGSGWEMRIRERGWIMRDGKLWRMWYTGYDGTRQGRKKLGYATSSDGVRWKRHPGNPIYKEHWIEDVMIVHRGKTWYMFAEGAKDQAQLLTSPDGIRWKRVGPLDVRKQDGRPIEPGPYGTPTAYFQNDRWYLFYERGDAGVWLATSTDMRIWRNVQDEPVLKTGPADYDSRMIALNQIVEHAGRYYALYHGSGTEKKPRLWTTNIAVSDDLIHWKKYARNPLLPARENKSSGILVYDGSRFRLYTMHDRVDLHQGPAVAR